MAPRRIDIINRAEGITFAEAVADGQTFEVDGRAIPVIDPQPTAMQRAVVCAAQHHQIVRIIVTTLRAQLQMMKIDVGGIAATWNDAAPSISPEDFATDRRSGVLRGALTLQSRNHARSMFGPGIGLRGLVENTHVGVLAARRKFPHVGPAPESVETCPKNGVLVPRGRSCQEFRVLESQ